MRRRVNLGAVALSVVLLAACAGGCQQRSSAKPEPLPAAMATGGRVPTGTPLPTALPSRTSVPPTVPLRTSTSVPRVTPSAIASPVPTETPKPRATPTPGVLVTPIDGVTAGLVDEVVTIEGQVVASASFQYGFKLAVDDTTGRIVVLMWHDVYDDCWAAPDLNVGSTVRVTGRVGVYEGEVQIQPAFGGDVKVLSGGGAWATRRDIGSIAGADEGQRIMIEGRVIRVEGRDEWAKVFVGDDTGETLVFIWRNVLDRIPDNVGLGVEGTRVRVVGTVEVYRSNLQVRPALPFDVTVLQGQ